MASKATGTSTTRKRSPAKNRRTSQAENDQILEFVKTLNLETILSDYSKSGESVNAAMNVVTSRITEGIKTAQELDMAIVLKEGRLQELYQIEEQMLNIQEIEVKAEESQTAADRTRQERSQEWKDSGAMHKQEVERLSEAGAYTQQQAESRWATDFDARKASTERTETIRRDDLQRDWDEREAHLKEQETHLKESEELVDGFDEVLAAAKVVASLEATESTSKQFEHQLEILRRENSGSAALRDQQARADGQTMDDLRAQIVALNDDLDAAQLQVQTTTQAALDSASGRAALDATQQTVAAKSK